MTKFHFQEGEVLLINKPLEWTSFQVVNKIRHAITKKLQVKKIKVGHAGTLDPLATGLLILCTGKKTKSIDNYQAQEKEYTGHFAIGKTTPSVDMETSFDSENDWQHITADDIKQTIKTFTGHISQVPPAHSAVKVGGKRAYESARKGEEIELKSRNVEIKEFEILSLNLPEVNFRVVCSKGTYIRSLVRDIGNTLGCGAYLSELTRTRIGDFQLSDAQSIDDLVKTIQEE